MCLTNAVIILIWATFNIRTVDNFATIHVHFRDSLTFILALIYMYLLWFIFANFGQTNRTRKYIGLQKLQNVSFAV